MTGSCRQLGLILLLIIAPNVAWALTSYANEFITPGFLLARNWSDITKYARNAIVQGATQIAAEGPWSESPGAIMSAFLPRLIMSTLVLLAVTSKAVMPPSNNTQSVRCPFAS